MDAITILKLLETSGLGNILSGVIEKNNNVEKLKLEFIRILISAMDDEGRCKVKEVLDKLLDEKHLFDFIGGDND